MLLLWRWVYNKGKTIHLIQDGSPYIFFAIMPLLRKELLSTAIGQGMGRYTEDEVMEMGAKDLRALSHILGSKPFFTGAKATEVDCAVFGSLAQVLWCCPGSPMERMLHGKIHPFKIFFHSFSFLSFSFYQVSAPTSRAFAIG